MRLILHEGAKAELRKSRRWYNARQEGLGFDLLEDVTTALSRIEQNPRLGIRYLDTPYSFYRTKRFPFVIYYIELPDHVCVMAIAHKRRRPGYWKQRMPE